MTELRFGSLGEEVRQLQRRLQCTPDAVFGPETRAAVIMVQLARGLTPSGIVDEATHAAIWE